MALNEFRPEPVGLARGGAVADRDQFHPMLSGKLTLQLSPVERLIRPVPDAALAQLSAGSATSTRNYRANWRD
jgi:hypothetical protein